jgi:hypothetical protein
MKFAKHLFSTAGIYGLLILLPQYFLEQKTGRDFPPPISHPEFYYGFIGVAVAWQILFLIIAQDPARYRAAMLAAVAEKASFGIAVIALFLQNRVTPFLLVFGTIDMLLGALFLIAYAKTRRESSPCSLKAEDM